MPLFDLLRSPRSWIGVTLIAAVAGAAPLCFGGTVRHDVDDSLYLNLGDPHPEVGLLTVNSFSFGSGTLIAPDWVLTAGHVVVGASEIIFTVGVGDEEGFMYLGHEYAFHENYDDTQGVGPAGGFDIGLVHLSEPVLGVLPAERFYGNSLDNLELAQVGMSVGFGATGTGISGMQVFDGGRRAGENVIDSLATDPRIINEFIAREIDENESYTREQIASQFILSDFDDPPSSDTYQNDNLNPLGSANPLPLEYSVGVGDSGGPVYIDSSQGPLLAGIHSFVHALPEPDGDRRYTTEDPTGAESDNASYSDLYGSLRVAMFNAWIDEVVPDPAYVTWEAGSTGNWSDTANWANGMPSGEDATANFFSVTGSPRSVIVDTPQTVGTLNFRTTDSHTLSGQPITMQMSFVTAAINVAAGSHTIASPLVLNGNTNILVRPATSTLNITGNIDAGSETVIRKTGAGALQINGLRASRLAISGGTVRVAPDGSSAGLVRLRDLTIFPNTTFDLNDNDLLIDYDGFDPSPYETIRQYVADGRATGDSGIISGTAAGDQVLAVVDNAVFGRGSWMGEFVDTSTIIGKYTFYGDANLDGKVTGDDYVAIDANLGRADAQWIHGDFNFDGVTTGDDYVAIDANLGKGAADPAAFTELKAEMVALHTAMFGQSYLTSLAIAEAEGFAAVPEPAGLVSLLGGAVLMLRRGHRRSAAAAL